MIEKVTFLKVYDMLYILVLSTNLSPEHLCETTIDIRHAIIIATVITSVYITWVYTESILSSHTNEADMNRASDTGPSDTVRRWDLILHQRFRKLVASFHSFDEINC